MLGPDARARFSKRVWEGSIQAWRRELAEASAQFVPVGFRGYV